MPKPIKKARKSTDLNVTAADMVRRSLAAHESAQAAVQEPKNGADTFKEQLSDYMSRLGRKGGKISGAKRMEMPVEQRREIASKAAQAMWAKRKKTTKKR